MMQYQATLMMIDGLAQKILMTVIDELNCRETTTFQMTKMNYRSATTVIDPEPKVTTIDGQITMMMIDYHLVVEPKPEVRTPTQVPTIDGEAAPRYWEVHFFLTSHGARTWASVDHQNVPVMDCAKNPMQ